MGLNLGLKSEVWLCKIFNESDAGLIYCRELDPGRILSLLSKMKDLHFLWVLTPKLTLADIKIIMVGILFFFLFNILYCLSL